MRNILLAAALATAVSIPALAQQAKQSSQPSGAASSSATPAQPVTAETWRASRLIDKPVYGNDGDKIGEIHDLVVGVDGKLQKVIIEAGGFLDIADTHFAVPWEKVKVSKSFDRITVPVDNDNVEQFNLFGENDIVRTGPRAWTVEQLTGEYVLMKTGVGYGIVEDVLFGKNGQVVSVLAEPAIGYPGPYAFPYAYGAWYPAYGYYEVPYGPDDLAGLDTFEYGEYDDVALFD